MERAKTCGSVVVLYPFALAGLAGPLVKDAMIHPAPAARHGPAAGTPPPGFPPAA